MANHAKCCVAVDDVLVEGGRTGVLLIHRLGGSPADMAFITEGLAQDGYTVACPVLFGHCGSRDLLGATTWGHWYKSVQDAHDELKTRCDTVIVAGLGVGALLALHLACERPTEVHAVVLLSPTFWPNGWAMPWHSTLFRLIDHKGLANLLRFDDRPPYGIKDEVLRRAMLDGLDVDGRSRADSMGRCGGVLLELKWLAKTVLPELPRVSQPCLIFHSRHDDRSSLSASQLLQRRLCGIVDLVVLEDSYHLVTLDRQRPFVLDRILEFAAALPRLLQKRPMAKVSSTVMPGKPSAEPVDASTNSPGSVTGTAPAE